MNAYEEAIRQYGQQQQKAVWLDIGTGAHMPLTRLLLKYKVAEHVYAVEANSKTYQFAKTLRENLSDEEKRKISLYGCYSKDVDWHAQNPRPNAIIHEIVGCVSSDEGCIKVMHDTIKNLNENVSLCIPYSIGTLCMPVSRPKLSLTSSFCSFLLCTSMRIVKKVGIQGMFNPPKDAFLCETAQFIEKFILQDYVKKPLDKCRIFKTKFIVEKSTAKWAGFYLAPYILTSMNNTNGVGEINALKRMTNWPVHYIQMYDYRNGRNVKKGDKIHIVFETDLTTECPTFDEEHVALNFYKCLESILESTSHTFETETTLDHDDELDNQDVENLLAFTSTNDHLDPLKDTDYELIDEHNLQNHFSLEYMKRVVDCYDEINPITGYAPNQVLNTDQIGLELELHGDRTLTYSGEKSTWDSVRSLGATTHSYTIQPTITMGGCVLNPLYMCLKEVSGHISENLKKNLFNAKNIVLTCSKSGKLTSSLVTYWRDHCLIPNLRSRTLLLLDSLPYQVHPDVYKELKHFEYRVIPPKTTPIIQPLDIYYNRQHKKIVRRIYDHLRLDEIDINLSERNNLSKLQSLAHSQMCSKAFQPMIKYAWFKAGFLKHDPRPFRNVNDICFIFQTDRCHEESCIDGPMIRCSWCQQELCFTHFF
ncbi:unnamed protein product [Rotaria sp. Silwood1]|nr:unnamed protein product [Rotaria sp. Silwood1]